MHAQAFLVFYSCAFILPLCVCVLSTDGVYCMLCVNQLSVWIYKYQCQHVFFLIIIIIICQFHLLFSCSLHTHSRTQVHFVFVCLSVVDILLFASTVLWICSVDFYCTA